MSDSSDSDHKKKKRGWFGRKKGSDSDSSSSSSSSDEDKKKEKRKVKRKSSSSSNEEKKRKDSKGSKHSSDDEKGGKKRRGSKGSKKSSDEEKEVVKAEQKSEVVITESPGVEVKREVKVKTLDNGVEQVTTEVRTVTSSEHEVVRQERKIMVQEYEVVTKDNFGQDMPGFDVSDPNTQFSSTKTVVTKGNFGQDMPGFDLSDQNTQFSSTKTTRTVVTKGSFGQDMPGFDSSDPNTQISSTNTVVTHGMPEFNMSDSNTSFTQTKSVFTTTKTHYSEVKDGDFGVQNVTVTPVIQETSYVIKQKSENDDEDKEKRRSRSGSESSKSSKSSKSSDDEEEKKKKSSKSSSDDEKEKSGDEKDKSGDEKADSDNEKKKEKVEVKQPDVFDEGNEPEVVVIKEDDKAADDDDVKITWVLKNNTEEVKSGGSDDEKGKKSGSDSSSSDSEDEEKKDEKKDSDKEDEKKCDDEKKEKKKSDSESSDSEDEDKKKTKKEIDIPVDVEIPCDEDEKKKKEDEKDSSSDEDEKKKGKDEKGSSSDEDEKKKLDKQGNDDDKIIVIGDDPTKNIDIVVIDDKPEVAIVEQPIQAEAKKNEDVLDPKLFPKKPEKSPEKNKKSFKMPELPKIISSKKPAAKPVEAKKDEKPEPEVQEDAVQAETRKSTDNLDMFANKDKPKTDESKSDTPKTTENKESEVKVVTDVKVIDVPSPDAKKDDSGPSVGEANDATPEDTTVPPDTSNGEAAPVRSPAWDTLVPATTYWSTKRDGSVLLRSTETGPLSLPPMTIPDMVQQTVDKVPDRVALNVKKEGAWVKLTYKQYLDNIKKAAKGFIRLGLEPYHTVCILGENSPEWAISSFAAIFAGGLATGIFTDCTPEGCEDALTESDANIAVVENDFQLKKVLQAWPALPKLKAIVQITGDHSDKRDNVYTWAELMNLSEEVADDTLQIRLDSLAPNKACLIVHTSGTTGEPKPILYSHDNVVWMTDRLNAIQDKNEFGKDVIVSFTSFTHIIGLMWDIIVPISNATTVYFAQPDALKGSLVDTMKEVKPTMFFAVPAVWELIMDKMKEKIQEKGGLKRKIHSKAQKIGLQGTPALLKRMKTPFGFGLANTFIYKSMKKEVGLERCRMASTGADTVEKSMLDFFYGYNIPVFPTYGIMECTGPQTVQHPEKFNLDTVGYDIDGCTSKIVKDQDGNDEICIWGRHVMMGYLNKEQMTAEVSTDDNWFRTGDIGQLGKKGFLTFIDKIKDCVVLESGEVVTPSPIENNVHIELPVISQCVVTGDKRKFISMLITLKVVSEKGVSTDKLSKESLDWCKAVGSESTTVSQILETKDENVYKAIQEGINRANIKAVSHTCQVKKWCILPNNLSSNGNLFTLLGKLKRYAVNREYSDTINNLYDESET